MHSKVDYFALLHICCPTHNHTLSHCLKFATSFLHCGRFFNIDAGICIRRRGRRRRKRGCRSRSGLRRAALTCCRGGWIHGGRCFSHAAFLICYGDDSGHRAHARRRSRNIDRATLGSVDVPRGTTNSRQVVRLNAVPRETDLKI